MFRHLHFEWSFHLHWFPIAILKYLTIQYTPIFFSPIPIPKLFFTAPLSFDVFFQVEFTAIPLFTIYSVLIKLTIIPFLHKKFFQLEFSFYEPILLTILNHLQELFSYFQIISLNSSKRVLNSRKCTNLLIPSKTILAIWTFYTICLRAISNHLQSRNPELQNVGFFYTP